MTTGQTLVSADWLAARCHEPDLRIVDTRFSLADTRAGRRAYDLAHLPGAVYLHLDQDLSGEISPSSGRHPLPDPQRFAARLGRAGIGDAHHVVIYDDAGGAIAARLWWMLRWLGHEWVAILDGGYSAWIAAGHGVSSETVSPAPAVFTAEPRRDMLITVVDVIAGLSSGELLLVDARESERFRGEQEPIDTVAGRVPGAINFPFRDNLGPDGRLLPGEELSHRWARLLAGRPPERVACMCGSGVTACLNLLAMEVAGMAGGRLYAGSWSEWISDSDRPVATGGSSRA